MEEAQDRFRIGEFAELVGLSIPQGATTVFNS